ncbi:MAG: hypothetical protein N5P05_001994 [Chroococcopsis gigantea SAG 12.99]|nr:hypothetical protein [Chlorogloea purpurea SAG 13.99]MDV3000388.1 hypothetical protein [Chroococcopsis gigantea SAG 12.99]
MPGSIPIAAIFIAGGFKGDGSGAGAAVQLASLTANLNLTAADIFIGG